MKKYYKFLLMALVASLMSSCATTVSRQSLDNQQKTNIQSNRILLNSTQLEIVMEHNNWFNSDLPDPYSPLDSGAIVRHNIGYQPQAGLIGALAVDAIKQHQASTGIKEMVSARNSLNDFDFLNYFNSELRVTVAKLPWLKVRKQEVKYNLQNSEAEIVANSKENTTLLIGTTYALNSSFRVLKVATYVKLVQKSEDNHEPRTLYANNFYFVNRLDDSTKNTDENKERWTKDNGALLRTKLRDAAALLSRMIATDIENTNINSYSANNIPIELNSFEGFKVKGNLIKKMNGYYNIALLTGEIYAVNSADIIPNT